MYNVSCILESYGQTDLLNYMNTYWINDNGNQEEFWEHEWNKVPNFLAIPVTRSVILILAKHGTCYSTLNPSCFPNYTPEEDVVAFFQQVVNQFQQLDTYSVRAIVPRLPHLLRTRDREPSEPDVPITDHYPLVPLQRRHHPVKHHDLRQLGHPGGAGERARRHRCQHRLRERRALPDLLHLQCAGQRGQRQLHPREPRWREQQLPRHRCAVPAEADGHDVAAEPDQLLESRRREVVGERCTRTISRVEGACLRRPCITCRGHDTSLS